MQTIISSFVIVFTLSLIFTVKGVAISRNAPIPGWSQARYDSLSQAEKDEKDAAELMDLEVVDYWVNICLYACHTWLKNVTEFAVENGKYCVHACQSETILDISKINYQNYLARTASSGYYAHVVPFSQEPSSEFSPKNPEFKYPDPAMYDAKYADPDPSTCEEMNHSDPEEFGSLGEGIDPLEVKEYWKCQLRKCLHLYTRTTSIHIQKCHARYFITLIEVMTKHLPQLDISNYMKLDIDYILGSEDVHMVIGNMTNQQRIKMSILGSEDA
jgi:hypothetical protein